MLNPLNYSRRLHIADHGQRILRCCLLVCCGLLASGCGGETDKRTKPTAQSDAEVRKKLNADLFQTIARVINDPEQFGEGNTAETLIDRLNQWGADRQEVDNWQPDPLLKDLPPELAGISSIKQLGGNHFNLNEDLFAFFEAAWLREIGRAATGDEPDDLVRALRLFDWAVRNIAYEPAEYAETPSTSYETLLLGKGVADDRAWVFMLLARHQGLDAVRLVPTVAPKSTNPELQPCLVGVLIENEVYLFDAGLGLPLPGPDGKSVATLAQAASDDQLLRAWDLPNEPYPLSAADLSKVTAYIESTPSYLSRRMYWIANKLSGAQKLALTSSPTTVAQRLTKIPQVTKSTLWTLPLERLEKGTLSPTQEIGKVKFERLQPFQNQPMSYGRTRQLLAKYSGEGSAHVFYRQLRVPDKEIADQVRKYQTELFKSERARTGQALTDEQLEQSIDSIVKHAIRTKQNATYWLGLMAFERYNFDSAIDFFGRHTLDAYPDGPWTAGARYNLARAYEANGDTAEAIAMYELDISPQRHGSLLRAKKLQTAAKRAEPAAATEPKPDTGPTADAPKPPEESGTPTDPPAEPASTEPAAATPE